MQNIYIENLKVRFFQSALNVNDCADQKDINRNHVNYGRATTLAGILLDFGYDVKLPVWEDKGYLKIPFIQVNDWRIDFHNK